MWIYTSTPPYVFTQRVAVNYLNSVNSRFADMSMSPCSPDLSPPDFLHWGHMKSKVYDTRPATADDLKITVRKETESLGISGSVMSSTATCL
jgi:hypothetical protein